MLVADSLEVQQMLQSAGLLAMVWLWLWLLEVVVVEV